MTTITDDRLGELANRHDERGSAEIRDALIELRQLRSALAADRDRVRSVVVRAIDQLSDLGIVARDRIATRVADQLATATGLSIEDRDVLLRMRKSIQYSGEFTALLDRLLGAKP